MNNMFARMADVILTSEKEPSVQAKQKANELLLPKTFYGQENLVEERNVSITIPYDEEKQPNRHQQNLTELLSFKILKPFQEAQYGEKVYETDVTIFKSLHSPLDCSEFRDARVLLYKTKENQQNHTILFISEENIYLQETVTTEMSLQFRFGQHTILDLDLRTESDRVKYALQFVDMSSAECFKEAFIGIQSNRIPIISSPSSCNGAVFGSSSGPTSFASLAASGNTGFKSNSGQIFSGAGASLFGSRRKEEGVDGGYDDENNGVGVDHDVYVEPIVQLTTVSVSSGEEQEDVFFGQRCKLYRFDSSNKKWKERGVGDIKLLRHRVSLNSRLVMRRDQVHKICANHILIPTITLKPFPTNELTVMWSAFQDISENTPEDIMLAAKFKNSTILSDFKNVFSKLCNGDVAGLIPIDCSYVPEDGSEVKSRLGACDPKLASMMKEY